MADLDFFFDPVCPWAWITSRWVAEVQSRRDYDVAWRFISLKMLNSETDYSKFPPMYRDLHAAGTKALRVAARARAERGNEAVAAVYEMFGTSFHNRAEGEKFLADARGRARELLSDAGLPAEWCDAVDDESYDELIGRETEIALSRAGRDVGTPIITFRPGAADEGSFFGPVVARTPRGDEALRLWDAIETIATTSGVAELKRSLRGTPSYD